MISIRRPASDIVGLVLLLVLVPVPASGAGAWQQASAAAVEGQEQSSGADLANPTAEEREAAERAPLFASSEVLDVRLSTDVDRVKKDRDEDFEEQPGVLSYLGPDGDSVRLDVQVRTRGNFRRERRNCNFPPLRVNIRTSQAEGTVFEGEDKLKLVTPCHDSRGNYERYVLREYLAYRLFEVLTPRAFRTRLLRITYEDVTGEQDPRTLYAFFLESEERLAQRLGGVVREIPQLHPLATDPEYSTLVALFQLMIGNTDWSPVAFHNTIALRDGEGRYLTVPYDFDFSGLVDARYAAPDPSLGTKTVKERLYRGFCRHDVDVAAVAAGILERRPAVDATVESLSYLDDGQRRDVLRYLEGFWRILESEGRFDREVVRPCRSLG